MSRERAIKIDLEAETVQESTNDKGKLADFAKKILLTGLGAVSMGERLPKEAVGYLLEQAEKKKEDLVDRMAVEISKFLARLDVSQEIKKALRGLEIDVHATLRFSGKDAPADASNAPFSVKTKRNHPST